MLGSVDTIRYILGVGQKVFSKCVVLFFCGKKGGERFFMAVVFNFVARPRGPEVLNF